MLITIGCPGYRVFVLLCATVVHQARGAKYTLGMNSESSCTKTHFYEAGDVFTASIKGRVHDSHCPLTFIRSGSEGSDTSKEPCVCLCVKITEYTLESCQVQLSYHDGLNDFNPATFDCHKYPPIMWCSSKNDLKVTVSELSGYRSGQKYAITLEVKPFCGRLKHSPPIPAWLPSPRGRGHPSTRRL